MNLLVTLLLDFVVVRFKQIHRSSPFENYSTKKLLLHHAIQMCFKVLVQKKSKCLQFHLLQSRRLNVVKTSVDTYERQRLRILCQVGDVTQYFENKVVLDRYYTLPRPSEISMKNWRAKMKAVLKSHLWYKAMFKVWRKSWEPFRTYQLTSIANLAKFKQLWPDWMC